MQTLSSGPMSMRKKKKANQEKWYLEGKIHPVFSLGKEAKEDFHKLYQKVTGSKVKIWKVIGEND